MGFVQREKGDFSSKPGVKESPNERADRQEERINLDRQWRGSSPGREGDL